jgi:ribonuclease VapC
MVVDTSALVAILQAEPDRRTFTEALEEAGHCVMSAASFVEVSMVIETRFGARGVQDLDLLMSKAGIDIVSVDREQALMARRAFARFGKGRHPAGLNFGDCFAYALAEARTEPLLFKGDDFAKTDIESAIA